MWKSLFTEIFRIEPATGVWWLDLLVPVALSFIVFRFAFDTVGKMYSFSLIHSRSAGRFFHWFIRLGTVYILIYVFNFILSHWEKLIVFVIIVIGFIVIIQRYVTERRIDSQ